MEFSTPYPADINGDGFVDGADAGILISNWGMEGLGFAQGNLNGDNFIDGADAGILIANWPVSSSATVIPEPSTLLLSLLTLSTLCITRRHRA